MPNGLPVTIRGVSIYDPGYGPGTLAFVYGNSRGLIFTSNGYLGPQPGDKNYYLLWKLSCQYSNDIRFNQSFEPNLDAAADAVIASWELFTGSSSAAQPGAHV
jgi:hypothetical protein